MLNKKRIIKGSNFLNSNFAAIHIYNNYLKTQIYSTDLGVYMYISQLIFESKTPSMFFSSENI